MAPKKPGGHSTQRLGGSLTLTHILVHVEGLHIFEGQVSVLVVLNEFLIAAKWGAPYKKGPSIQPWLTLLLAV